ncbi:MAG: acetylglutamate kinase [Arenicella sp.]|jgi:acetylglutamate kinase
MKSKLTIVKIGGKLIDDSSYFDAFMNEFSKLEGDKILIHGGGKIATEMNAKLGYETKMHEGRRITTSENLEVVVMVYAGLLNKRIVAALQARNCNALGLSGADGNVILASERPKEPIDFGCVGDLEKIDSELINLFLDKGIVPVFSAISHNGKGQLLNTNADTMASEIAISLTKSYQQIELIYCFEKKGVLLDLEEESSVIEQINVKEYEDLKSKKVIHEGMLPKLQNAFHAKGNGVSKVKIGSLWSMNNKEEVCTEIT